MARKQHICDVCGFTAKSKGGLTTHKRRHKAEPEAPPEPPAVLDAEPRAAAEPAPAEAPPAAEETPRLVWVLNGPGWQAQSIKIPSRTYRCTYGPEHGWSPGYDGQKGSCPAAGQHLALASDARRACQKVEDAIT